MDLHFTGFLYVMQIVMMKSSFLNDFMVFYLQLGICKCACLIEVTLNDIRSYILV